MNWRVSISLNLVAQLLNIAINFFLAILIARLLGAEGRGAYVLVITTAMFFMQAFSLGLESSISYYAASGKTGLRRLISTVGLLFLIIMVCLAGVLCFFSFFPVFKIVPYDELSYYTILFLLALTYIGNSFFGSLFNGLKEFNKVILVNLSLQALTLMFCLCFFLLGKPMTIKALLYATLGLNTLIVLVFVFFYRKKVGLLPGRDIMNQVELKAFFTYSFTAFLCSLLQFLNHRMDFWVINYYYGNANLGVYSLSSSLSQMFWIIPQSIAIILFPLSGYIQEKELIPAANKLCRIALFITLIILPIACALALLIPLLFGKDFSASVPLFYIFLTGVLPFILVVIPASVFAGTGKLQYNFMASLAGFGVACLAYFLLIPLFGLTGGAIASSLSYAATGFLGMYLYRKRFEVSLRDMVLIKSSDIKELYSFLPGRA